ncbi:MAG: N-acetylmuramic acid 6-phosphate etherase [Ruminococcaceae bacterium]|nr:N-acetylmuramic acid 6-phosphate etherase [Oscillospiraceae bacterium]
MNELKKLATEGRNPRSAEIDKASPAEIAAIINAEDKTVADAVEKALPQIAAQIEAAAYALQHGGRLIYIGAGTSGRLGVLDAAECRPTYGVDDNTVVGLIAGGMSAMFSAVEGAEDSLTLAEEELRGIGFCEKDFLVGIAASGRTPYVKGGLAYARSIGAVTGSIACTAPAEISALADIPVEVVTGPEVVTGSTRMKAGTAQKMVLNMLSTGAMIRCGKVMGNLMVDVQATNDKLRARALRIVMEAADADRETAEKALTEAGGSAKKAILSLLA